MVAAVGLVTAWVVDGVLAQVLPHAFVETLATASAGALSGVIAGMAMAGRWLKPLRSALPAPCVALATAALAFGLAAAADLGSLGERNPAVEGPILAGCGGLVWLIAAIWERRSKQRSGVFTGLLGGLALAACLLNTGAPIRDAFSGKFVRAWNVFHYYVGSKYYAELGHDGLYAAALTADDDWLRKAAAVSVEERTRMRRARNFHHIQRTRDMQTYEIVPRKQAVRGFDRSRFTPERFEEFGRDTRALRSQLSARTWTRVFCDLGYNPSPAWTVFGTPFANLVPLDRLGFALIATSDLAALVLAFASLWWAFGSRVALCALLWLTTIPFNFHLLIGGFLHYDWLASCALGLALYHRGWPKLAGACMSWAVMTRLFPALFVVPLGVAFVRSWGLGRRRATGDGSEARGRRFDPRQLGFLLALTVSCAALFGLSHGTGRGLRTWPDWAEKIGMHADQHASTSSKRLGLGRLMLHAPTPNDFWNAASKNEGAGSTKNRALEATFVFAGLALLAVAAQRRRDEDAMLLMLFAAFLLITVSRYYASLWMLLFALGTRRDGVHAPWPSVVSGTSLLAMAALFRVPDGDAGHYFFANYEAAAMFVVLCLGFSAPRFMEWAAAWRRAGQVSPDGGIAPVSLEDPGSLRLS